MAVPEPVRERLGGEEPGAHVSLGGEDELWVTPTRGLVYRAEGLLSGETVEEYPLEAQTIALSEGRRKTTIRLDRGYDGADEFTVPADHTNDALRPVVEGVLTSAGVTDDGEAVKEVFRLGELTLMVTDGRVVKHVGSPLWDEEDFEEYPYEDVTNLELEHGSVSSELVIEVDGRPQRIKTPSEDAHEIRKTIEGPLLATHEVDSVAALRRKFDPEAEEPAEPGTEEDPATDDTEADDGLGSLLESGGLAETGGGRAATASTQPDAEEDRDTEDLAEEVAALREAVERQGERIEEQRVVLERLIEELQRAG
jgi:hypothetical protein